MIVVNERKKINGGGEVCGSPFAKDKIEIILVTLSKNLSDMTNFFNDLLRNIITIRYSFANKVPNVSTKERLVPICEIVQRIAPSAPK